MRTCHKLKYQSILGQGRKNGINYVNVKREYKEMHVMVYVIIN